MAIKNSLELCTHPDETFSSMLSEMRAWRELKIGELYKFTIFNEFSSAEEKNFMPGDTIMFIDDIGFSLHCVINEQRWIQIFNTFI